MSMFDELKSVGKVLQDAGKIEQYQQILIAQEKMLEMQKKINDITEENRSLNDRLKVKDALLFESDAYWILKDGKKDGPFCSGCWDRDNKLIRMHSYNKTKHACPACKTCVETSQSSQSITDSNHEEYDDSELGGLRW